MIALVTIVEEPRGKTYLDLPQFAFRNNSLFSRVWRDEFIFGPSAIAVADLLRPYLVTVRRTDEWPGTQLFGDTATVRFYRMAPAGLSTLMEAGGLYAWISPERPGDIAFYVDERNPWLGSIAHEKDAFVYPDAVDVQKLLTEVQGLKLERVAGK